MLDLQHRVLRFSTFFKRHFIFVKIYIIINLNFTIIIIRYQIISIQNKYPILTILNQFFAYDIFYYYCLIIDIYYLKLFFCLNLQFPVSLQFEPMSMYFNGVFSLNLYVVLPTFTKYSILSVFYILVEQKIYSLS